MEHTRPPRLLRLALITGSLVLLSACTALAPPYEASAFGSDKVYALVSVFSPKDVEGGETTTLRGALTDARYYFPAAPALKASIPGIEKALAGHSAFRLYSPRKLKKNPAYLGIRPDTRPRGIIVAPGYKFIVTPDKLAGLAGKLGVDGVIVLKLDYRFKFYGHKWGGIAATGKTNPVIKVDLRFFDRNGKLVYQTKGSKTWNKGAPSRDEGADPKRMLPLLTRAAPETVRVIANRLDARLKDK
jgi:hypothetical protein